MFLLIIKSIAHQDHESYFEKHCFRSFTYTFHYPYIFFFSILKRMDFTKNRFASIS